MADDSWEKRRLAAEEQFFAKQNAAALERMKGRKQAARPSPITGEPMEQIAMRGVVLDRCPTSGGIWLDAGELETILSLASKDSAGGEGYLQSFFSLFSREAKK